VPEWVAGSDAAVALLWARKEARAATEPNHQQARQIADLEDQKGRSQAESVAVWVGWATSQNNRIRLRALFVTNSSRLPVYYGGIYVPHPNKRDVTLELREPSVIPPTPEPLVAPLRVPNDNTYDDKEADRAGMIFVDSTGRYWHRNVNGVLTEETTESYDRLIEKHIAQFPSWRDLRHLGGDALSL